MPALLYNGEVVDFHHMVPRRMFHCFSWAEHKLIISFKNTSSIRKILADCMLPPVSLNMYKANAFLAWLILSAGTQSSKSYERLSRTRHSPRTSRVGKIPTKSSPVIRQSSSSVSLAVQAGRPWRSRSGVPSKACIWPRKLPPLEGNKWLLARVKHQLGMKMDLNVLEFPL
jgi:hypothetical protein